MPAGKRREGERPCGLPPFFQVRPLMPCCGRFLVGAAVQHFLGHGDDFLLGFGHGVPQPGLDSEHLVDDGSQERYVVFFGLNFKPRSILTLLIQILDLRVSI